MDPAGWREAFDELARRKLRTGLTLLGLIFGVGAIVAMQAVGEGSRREALRLVEGLGLNNLVVEAHAPADETALRELRQRSLGLSRADAAAALQVVPGAVATAAEKRLRTDSVHSDFAAADAQAVGVTPSFFALSSLAVAKGRLFDSEDELRVAPVAVLGHQAARSLFPSGPAVGHWIKVNHVWLEVVGVLADRDLSAATFEGVRLGLETNRVFVPLTTALLRFDSPPLQDEIDRFLLQLDRPEHSAAGARVLAELIRQRHAGADDFRLVVPAQLFQQHQQTQRIFQVVMGAIAAVSLLVGGIGIMNIMLANVLERRREIGLLRALGASQDDIVARFLREAAAICVAGALLGLVFGALLAYAIAAGAGWQVAWAPLPVLGAVLVCILVGLAFGVYPARQAAQLDPMSALRTD
ncbi:MAG: ABC transporter permease [Xanthomonadaceae bacterium]|nr:ABC transporter permease [Xanthomonadaceae bacterium]